MQSARVRKVKTEKAGNLARAQDARLSSASKKQAAENRPRNQLSPAVREDLFEIAEKVKPKVHLGNTTRPNVLAPRPLPKERPDDGQIIHNVLRRASEQVGLKGEQIETVLGAYDESLEASVPLSLHSKLPQVHPDVFLAIGDELSSESRRPNESFSKAELDQWFGFRTESATADQLKEAETELADSMPLTAFTANLASNYQFMNELTKKMGQNPELSEAIDDVLALSDSNALLVDAFGRNAPGNSVLSGTAMPPASIPPSEH
jgi:hypothetical protein